LHSVAAINNAVNNTTDMTLVDLKDIGLHYATTLVHWLEQFSKNISKIKELGFND
jgi:cyclopropane-fatty-acyl-phospholipid synthase